MEVGPPVSDVSLPAMRELQRLILRLNAGPDLTTTLTAVVDGVVEGLGFGVATVNLVQDDGAVEVVAVAGPPDVSVALLGGTSDARAPGRRRSSAPRPGARCATCRTPSRTWPGSRPGCRTSR